MAIGCSAFAPANWLISLVARLFGPACLKDAQLSVDFNGQTTPNDVVTLLATEALTSNEQWQPYQRGEWMLWRGGECIAKGQVPVNSAADQ